MVEDRRLADDPKSVHRLTVYQRLAGQISDPVRLTA
jgi:hypothetical protein